jgi:hypothetical protein
MGQRGVRGLPSTGIPDGRRGFINMLARTLLAVEVEKHSETSGIVRVSTRLGFSTRGICWSVMYSMLDITGSSKEFTIPRNLYSWPVARSMDSWTLSISRRIASNTVGLVPGRSDVPVRFDPDDFGLLRPDSFHLTCFFEVSGATSSWDSSSFGNNSGR